MKVDLHVHTHYSPDSEMSPQALITACQQQGMGAIAVTDHNTIAGALEVQQQANFTVIVGEEIKTLSGEIAGLFLSEEVPPLLSAQKTIERIKAQGGLVYIPHPFDHMRRSTLKLEALESLVPQIDVLEVFNARSLFLFQSRRAYAFARKHGLLQGCGSDAHTPYEIGHTYLEMPGFKDRESFLRGIAEASIAARRSSPLVHLLTRWTKYRKRLLGHRV